MAANLLIKEKVKVTARAAIELVLALSICRVAVFDWLYCFLIFGLACLRNIFYEQFDLQAYIFICFYVVQNLIVNTVDFFLFRKALNYYNDS